MFGLHDSDNGRHRFSLHDSQKCSQSSSLIDTQKKKCKQRSGMHKNQIDIGTVNNGRLLWRDFTFLYEVLTGIFVTTTDRAQRIAKFKISNI